MVEPSLLTNLIPNVLLLFFLHFSLQLMVVSFCTKKYVPQYVEYFFYQELFESWTASSSFCNCSSFILHFIKTWLIPLVKERCKGTKIIDGLAEVSKAMGWLSGRLRGQGHVGTLWSICWYSQMETQDSLYPTASKKKSRGLNAVPGRLGGRLPFAVVACPPSPGGGAARGGPPAALPSRCGGAADASGGCGRGSAPGGPGLTGG